MHNQNNELNFKSNNGWDFPSDPEVKNLACSAGEACSILGQGTKIPHAMKQVSPHAPTRDHVLQWKSPRDTMNEDPVGQCSRKNKYLREKNFK